MLEANRRRVQNLTGLEIWLFIVARALMAFGLGVLVMMYFPKIAPYVAVPAVIAGLVLFVVASRGMFRKPPG